MRILVTGFEPFDNHAVNSSERLIQRLEEQSLPGIEIRTRVLPVAFSKVRRELAEAIEREDPDAAVLLGLSSRTAKFHLEKVALNWQHAIIPDNEGAQPRDQAIIPGAPPALWTTAPILDWIERELKDEPVELSLSAGSYVCNSAYYCALHDGSTRLKSCLFIHIPPFEEGSTSLGNEENQLRLLLRILSLHRP